MAPRARKMPDATTPPRVPQTALPTKSAPFEKSEARRDPSRLATQDLAVGVLGQTLDEAGFTPAVVEDERRVRNVGIAFDRRTHIGAQLGLVTGGIGLPHLLGPRRGRAPGAGLQ